MRYNRHISDAFVDGLNALYEAGSGGWWRALLDDREIFLAFRDGTINAYYRGCSLAQISLTAGEVCVRTHYKYLLKPVLASPMITARGGIYEFPAGWRERAGGPFIETLGDLATIKRAAKPFAGGEKSFVADVIRANPNVFDVEIALTREATEEELEDGKRDKLADRIDIAALSTTPTGLELVFYEAKLFENQELRAGGEADARVIGQVRRYESLLKTYESEIRASCLKAAENVLMLRGMDEARKRQARIVAQAGEALSINMRPVLVIGGFDADQKREGSVWRGHLKKLTDALGEDRVVARGDAAGVRLGKWEPKPEPAL